VGEHKTFLTKSAKLLRETEDDGLILVADAKPGWWRKGEELLAGFPRPDQVLGWWTGNNVGPTSESTRHAHHPQEESQNPDTYAKSGGRQPNRHPSDATRHPQRSTPLDKGGSQGVSYDTRVSGSEGPGEGLEAGEVRRVDEPSWKQ
jgi:hypothetical protein